MTSCRVLASYYAAGVFHTTSVGLPLSTETWPPVIMDRWKKDAISDLIELHKMVKISATAWSLFFHTGLKITTPEITARN